MKHLTIVALFVLFVPMFVSAESPIMCTMQYDPVCGTENGVYKTYGNGCVLGAEGATYQHEGECSALELKGTASAGTYEPPAHCTAWFDGCNRCGRSENGEAYCTLMACMGEPRAGYCTAYGDTETDTMPAPDESVSSNDSLPPEGPTTVEATTSAETDSGFFFRIWNSVRAWFEGLF